MVALAVALPGPAAPAAAQAPPFHYLARASLSPGHARLGEPVTYHGMVLLPPDVRVQWLPPDSGGAFTWGPLVASRSADTRRGRGRAARDTLRVSARLQVFALGRVAIPGLPFRAVVGEGGVVHRLPVVHLVVVPVITAKDSAADLRPVRGPLLAPWWERVPWRIVGLALVVLAAIIALIVWLRRRRRAGAAVPAPDLTPADEALAALSALRARKLPEHGQFAEHAFQLTQIVRRFLEATVHTPRPGDTTPELLGRVREARLRPDEVSRLASLLQTWDQVKFARAATTVDEARRAEQAVERLIRERMPVPTPTERAA
jgi:hypothetical protein